MGIPDFFTRSALTSGVLGASTQLNN
jgi:hypothetical protein